MKDTKCLHIQISAELIKRLVAELSSTALKVYKQKMTNSRAYLEEMMRENVID